MCAGCRLVVAMIDFPKCQMDETVGHLGHHHTRYNGDLEVLPIYEHTINQMVERQKKGVSKTAR
jgi:hypothetical protein